LCGGDNAALRRSYAESFGLVSVTLITVQCGERDQQF
jgi:hypothetical protein